MKSTAVLLGCILCSLLKAESDWSRFRGPNGTGISTARDLPLEFGPDKNVVWKTALPEGYSSPVLTSDRIFVTAAEAGKMYTIALDRASGKQLWKQEAPRLRADRLRQPNHPASSTPVTDGRNVTVFFQSFGLLSYTADGVERWRMPLGPFRIQYGFGASPVLADGLVIVPVDQDGGSYLIAVDHGTGRVRWKVERPEVISGYSTPILYQPAKGGAQILIAESFQLSAYSAKTGERIWYVRGLACEMKSVPSFDGNRLYINGWGWPENQPGRQIPLPSFEEAISKYDGDRDGRISASEMPHERLKVPGYFRTFDIDEDGGLNRSEWEICRSMMAAENGLLAIEVGGQGDMTARAVKWKYQRPVPQVPSTLLYGGALFMVNDSGILISFDPATGAVIKQGRLKGAIDKYFASPVGADGKVWLISQDGTISVVKAQGEWDVLAVNSLGDEVFATPAIDRGRIYVRTKSAMYCFGKR